jgi:hypothetical protein
MIRHSIFHIRHSGFSCVTGCATGAWEAAEGARKNFHILLLAARPMIGARAFCLTGDNAHNPEISKKSRGLEAAALRGAAAGGHLRRCRSSTMSPHRLRRGAWHLPARRSRKNANLFLREPLEDRHRPGWL